MIPHTSSQASNVFNVMYAFFGIQFNSSRYFIGQQKCLLTSHFIHFAATSPQKSRHFSYRSATGLRAEMAARLWNASSLQPIALRKKANVAARGTPLSDINSQRCPRCKHPRQHLLLILPASNCYLSPSTIV